jgi:hypothetical protein
MLLFLINGSFIKTETPISIPALLVILGEELRRSSSKIQMSKEDSKCPQGRTEEAITAFIKLSAMRSTGKRMKFLKIKAICEDAKHISAYFQIWHYTNNRSHSSGLSHTTG